ncbi:hypothetical protein [Pantoea agglomerans]|uniref:hypothetical protein n=1 Tax=Enterobacter agglomerans TaxID=549 RepID=UPI00177C4B4D|nr:hypothetical protein [Pantoea agglomerans]MBD8155019.1 hypothetical protein [Pantoea agglomerans]
MKKLTAEKCREQFEEWASTEFDTRLLKFHDGDYKSQTLHRMWLAWQASRQALEIALPILEQQERGDGEWIEWGGIHQPVNDSVVVRVKYRSGRQAEDSAACFNWGNSGSIIAYRIIPKQPTNQNGE